MLNCYSPTDAGVGEAPDREFFFNWSHPEVLHIILRSKVRQNTAIVYCLIRKLTSSFDLQSHHQVILEH